MGGSLTTIPYGNTSTNLVSGQLIQSGTANTMNLAVSGDRTDFSVTQIVEANEFTGRQVTSFNTMAVLQVGTGNTSTIVQ